VAPFARELPGQFAQADDDDHAGDEENGKHEERKSVQYAK
jgi:hypothetical protein